MAAKGKNVGVWLQKNYFWVVCGVMVCAVLAVWWISTARLKQDTQQRVQAIKAKEDLITRVRQQPNHPNQFTKSRMEELNAKLAEDVYDAWQRQYQKQRALLTWPALLGQDVIQTLQKLQPIEAKVIFDPNNPKEELDATARQRYRDFIDSELPKLADIIRAHWADDTGQFVARRMTSPSVVVHWDPQDQTRIKRTRFSWAGRWPTTLEILYAQEDYWVLRSIMEIIKATNGNVEHRYQAAVKTVEFIDIGRDAVGMGGTLGGIGGTMTGGGGGEADAAGGIMGFPASSMGGMAGSMGGLTAGAGGGATAIGRGEIGSSGSMGLAAAGPLVDPGDYRYVDTKFQPLTAQRIRSAFNSTSPDDAFLMVAKRMPVRMRLKVDQRKLPKLLAECGNAPMQLEVKQVRINQQPFRGGRQGQGGFGSGATMGGFGGASVPPGEPTGVGAAGGGGLDAGVSLPPPGSLGGRYGGAEQDTDADGAVAGAFGPSGPFFGGSVPPGTLGSGPMGTSQAGAVSDESPFDVDVEIYGIIYIYNPVDRTKLGKIEVKADDTPTEEAAADADSQQAG